MAKISDGTVYDWRYAGIKRGDTLLCVGNSKMSKRIQKFQKYTGAEGVSWQVSHVAKVIEYDSFSADPRLQVYESTSLNKWAGKSGVQVNPFEEWLASYDGMVFLRKWNFDRTTIYLHEDDLFISKHADLGYENGIPGGVELLLCGLRLHRFIRWAFPDYTPTFTSEPHCTELIGENKQCHSQLAMRAVINRLPPWMWWAVIDSITNVPVGKPIRLK
jgi:hypothetical protein